MDTEPFGHYRPSKIFGSRNESGYDYTIMSNSTTPVALARYDDTGSGQRFSIATIEVCSCLTRREDAPMLGWVPSHLGVEGIEIADEWAGGAAESMGDSVAKVYLCETARVAQAPPGGRPTP